VEGTGGSLAVPQDIVDVKNSGTTLYVALGTAALCPGFTVFTGDDQIRRRPATNLLASLRDLGATAFSTRDNGCTPIVVKGRLAGGTTSIACPTSQYLSSLLINCPLAEGSSTIHVVSLNERPYVQITLDWLTGQGIRFENDGMKTIRIPGGQSYKPFARRIPADFSSATFFLCAAAVTKSKLTLLGLDMNDAQGDKEVVSILGKMGCTVHTENGRLEITGGDLVGGEFDLNAMPDALPALAVTACYAEGETRLYNVAQARLKETDRIKVMHDELAKMGANVKEMPDGLVIRGSRLKGARIRGHADHRIVMAFAVAGLGAEGETVIDTAESASVTFPGFFTLLDNARCL
jgi:3-phosphoshikimate 1-carboxyvinyltransferase